MGTILIQGCDCLQGREGDGQALVPTLRPHPFTSQQPFW